MSTKGFQGTEERIMAAQAHKYDVMLVPTDAEIKEASEEVKRLAKNALYESFQDDATRRRFTSMFIFGAQKFLYSCEVDADYLGTEHFYQGEEREKNHDSLQVLLDKLIKYRDRYAAKSSKSAKKWMIDMRNDLWRSAIECGKNDGDVFTLTGSTGSGKTFAYMVLGLMKAIRENKDRVIIVLPHCSIITQVCDMLRKALGEKNVLEHHSGYDLDETIRNSRRYRQARGRTNSRNKLKGVRKDMERRIRESFENWDAPVVVTTREQFDESFFCRFPGRSRRVHNMANAVIVFDEVQSTPLHLTMPFMGELHVLRSLYKSTLILSTATQPAYVRKPHRLWGLDGVIEVVKKAKQYYTKASKRVQMHDLGDITVGDVANMLAHEHQAMCVCNTRQNSDMISQELTEMGVKHILMNTLIHKRRIRKIIQEVRRRLDRGERIILITTQIVEAGVDFSFPVGYSEKSPMDSQLQRAGRINRHGNLKKGVMHLFNLTDGNRNGGYLNAISVTESILYHSGDHNISKLDTMDLYYETRLDEKGDNLDKLGIIPVNPNPKTSHGGAEVVTSPVDKKTTVLRTKFGLYDKFRYIGGRVSIAIPVDKNCRDALDQIQDKIANGKRPGRKLLSTLQDYMVSIYDQEFEELNECADLEESFGFWILRDMSWYDKKRGLMVWNLPCHNK